MHTPGPWKHYEDKSGEIGIYMQDDDDSCGPQVATVTTENLVAETCNQAIADARLIAAAPEIIEALKVARKTIADILDNCPYFFPGHGDSSKLTDEQKAWRAKAKETSLLCRVIIAKAEGH